MSTAESLCFRFGQESAALVGCAQKETQIREETAGCLVKKNRLHTFKGTVSPDYKCLEVISIKSPLLGHVTPDI